MSNAHQVLVVGPVDCNDQVNTFMVSWSLGKPDRVADEYGGPGIDIARVGAVDVSGLVESRFVVEVKGASVDAVTSIVAAISDELAALSPITIGLKNSAHVGTLVPKIAECIELAQEAPWDSRLVNANSTLIEIVVRREPYVYAPTEPILEGNLLSPASPSGSTWPAGWVREGEHANLVPDSGCADDHYPDFNGSGVESTRETSAPVAFPDGIHACTKVVHSSSAGQVAEYLYRMPVTPGDVWTFSIYQHCSALVVDALAFDFRTYLDNALVRIGEGGSTYAINASFERITFTVTIAEGENQLSFRPRVYDGTTSATWWLAGMMVTKTPAAIPYFDGDSPDSYWLIPSPQLDPDLLMTTSFGNMGGGLIFAGTACNSPLGGYVWKSTDYGVTWDAGYRIGTTANVNVFIPLDSHTCICGSQNGSGVEWWKTTDAGVSWTQMTTDCGLGFLPGEYGHGGVVVSDGSVVLCTYGGGSGCSIYRSTDGGDTFTRVYAPAAQGIYWVEDMGGGVLMAGSGLDEGRVYRSTDYGVTWSLFQTITGSTHVLSIEACSDGSALLTTGHGANGGEVWKAPSVGAQFVEVQRLGVETFVYVARELSDHSIVTCSLPQGAVYRSDDFGDTWALIKENVAGASSLHDIMEVGQGGDHNGWLLAAADNYSRIGRSTDYGLTWSVPTLTPTESRQYLAHASGGKFHIADDAHAHATTIRSPAFNVVPGRRYGFGTMFGIDTFDATLCEVSVGWYMELGGWIVSTEIAAPSETQAESWRQAEIVAPAGARKARFYISWNGTLGDSHATAYGFDFGQHLISLPGTLDLSAQSGQFAAPLDDLLLDAGALELNACYIGHTTDETAVIGDFVKPLAAAAWSAGAAAADAAGYPAGAGNTIWRHTAAAYTDVDVANLASGEYLVLANCKGTTANVDTISTPFSGPVLIPTTTLHLLPLGVISLPNQVVRGGVTDLLRITIIGGGASEYAAVNYIAFLPVSRGLIGWQVTSGHAHRVLWADGTMYVEDVVKLNEAFGGSVPLRTLGGQLVVLAEQATPAPITHLHATASATPRWEQFPSA